MEKLQRPIQDEDWKNSRFKTSCGIILITLLICNSLPLSPQSAKVTLPLQVRPMHLSCDSLIHLHPVSELVLIFIFYLLCLSVFVPFSLCALNPLQPTRC